MCVILLNFFVCSALSKNKTKVLKTYIKIIKWTIFIKLFNFFLNSWQIREFFTRKLSKVFKFSLKLGKIKNLLFFFTQSCIFLVWESHLYFFFSLLFLSNFIRPFFFFFFVISNAQHQKGLFYAWTSTSLYIEINQLLNKCWFGVIIFSFFKRVFFSNTRIYLFLEE